MTRLIASNSEEVSQRPIDFYSIGHLVIGVIAWCVGYLICLEIVDTRVEAMLIACIIVFYVGIGWELIENIVLIGTRLKYGQKCDSLVNSLTDVVFCSLGGFIALAVVQCVVDTIAIVALLVVIVVVLLYFYCVARFHTLLDS